MTRATRPEEADSRRGFALHVRPAERDRFGVVLVETNGRASNARQVASLPAARYDKIADVIAGALTRSGHKPSRVRRDTDRPVPLEEMAGVRLALALAAIDGIRKPGRTRALVDGINRLTDEECLYWYAAAMSASAAAPRRLRALRLYLADD